MQDIDVLYALFYGAWWDLVSLSSTFLLNIKKTVDITISISVIYLLPESWRKSRRGIFACHLLTR
jgi:hypothetical protein